MGVLEYDLVLGTQIRGGLNAATLVFVVPELFISKTIHFSAIFATLDPKIFEHH